MSTLIRFFVELCLLRRGPQDLPGASALLGLFALAPLGLVAGAESRGETSLAGLPLLVLLFWSLLVTGHILRHGFDLRLGQGVLIAVAYNLLASALVNSLFPGS